jgi:hypothetical protein
MIRIGFGTTNISVGFGTGPNFKVIIKGIRIAIGTVVTTVAEIVIIAPVKARAVRPSFPSIKTTQNSQKVSSRELRLTDRKRHSLKRR